MKSKTILALIFGVCLFSLSLSETRIRTRIRGEDKPWPKKIKEIFSNKSVSVKEVCKNAENCLNWEQIKNKAYCEALKLKSKHADHSFFYVETRKKTLLESDTAQFLFTSIKDSDISLIHQNNSHFAANLSNSSNSSAVPNVELISICVPVSVKKEPYVNSRCPLDDCAPVSVEQEGKQTSCKTELKKDQIRISYQKGTESKSKPQEEAPAGSVEKKEESKAAASLNKLESSSNQHSSETSKEENRHLRLARLDQLEAAKNLRFMEVNSFNFMEVNRVVERAGVCQL